MGNKQHVWWSVSPHAQLIQYPFSMRGTRWRSRLRHCATSRKAAGSIPDGVIGIFHWHNPSGSTMALGSTQPLTEMSTRNNSWGVKSAGAWGWQSYDLHVRLSWNLGATTSWNPQDLSRPVMLFALLLFQCKEIFLAKWIWFQFVARVDIFEDSWF